MDVGELIEVGKVLDIFPGEGCVQFRVKGLRTGIEYLGCRHQVIGECPRVFENVNIERTEPEAKYAFSFAREGSEIAGVWVT